MTGRTILVDGNGGYVINQLSHADGIVMAGRAAINYTGMVVVARGKGSWTMTITTIESIANWNLNTHMIDFHSECGDSIVARITPDGQDCGVGMIGKCTDETLGVMAITTIGSGCRMGRHHGRFTRRINTIVIVVA